LSVILVGIALSALAGCGYSGSATATQVPAGLHGSVRGGQQPVGGASVQFYAAGTNGIGSAAPPLLSNPVKSDSAGNFSVPTSFYCPSASSQLYVVARGGNPGVASGTENPDLALMAMLGPCSSLSASTAISVNEVTTVGSVWPLAPYMKSPDDLGSTAGDANFLADVSSVNEFVDIANGSSPGISTPESYFAQNAKLYSLADVLDKCVNSTGGVAGDGSPCGELFSIATPTGGSAPKDTLTAAMRIAQSPRNQVTPIFDLSAAPTAFQPTLTVIPSDWTLSLSHPVATPSISLATGTYTGSQELTITDSTAGSIIYYTTDGTVPTSSSTQYSGALSIGVTSTVQAIAILGISQSSVASSTLTITTPTTGALPPAKIAFLQQPSNALIQAAISPAVTVAIEDANGNIVSSANNLIKLNLAGVTANLGGTLSIAAQNGTATFSNLTIGTAGSGYTLSATSAGLASATSASFTVSAPPSTTATATRLAFLQQPSNALTQAVISPAVTVAVEDANGNVVSSATNPVSLSLLGGATGLNGTLIVTPHNGIATFSNLTVATAASKYQLSATSAGLAPATSVSFSITAQASPTAMATQIAFLQQPTNTVTQAAISPAVTVGVLDQNGHLITTAGNAITLSLRSSSSVQTMSGTLTQAAVNGVATFPDLSVPSSGQYTMLATTSGLPAATSTAFSITSPSSPTGEQAVSALAFTGTVGINIHLTYDNTIYKTNFPLVLSSLLDLGIRHVRDGLVDYGPGTSFYYTEHQQLAANGIGGDFISSINQPESLLTAYPARVGDMEALEAPNEYDTSGDPQWAKTLAAYLPVLHDAVYGSQPMSGVSLYGPSLVNQNWYASNNSYAQLGPVSNLFDYGNLHNYQAGRNPGTPGWTPQGYGSIAFAISSARQDWPTVPIVTTEIGYVDNPALPSNIPDVPFAKYIPRVLLEQYLHGIVRTYVYSLADTYLAGDSYGLLRADGSEKPAYLSLRSMMHLLADPGASYTTGKLAWSMTGASSDVHHLLLQKRDGTFLLALWIEEPCYDVDAQTYLTVPPQNITLQFGNPVTIESINTMQTNGSMTVTTTENANQTALSLPVSDLLTFVELR